MGHPGRWWLERDQRRRRRFGEQPSRRGQKTQACVPCLQAEVMWALIEVYEEQAEDYARNSIRGSARFRLALPAGADKLHSYMWPRPSRLNQGRFSRGVCSLVGRWLGGQMLSVTQTIPDPMEHPRKYTAQKAYELFLKKRAEQVMPRFSFSGLL